MKIDAFIIGAQKSGSTALMHYLKCHPKIVAQKTPEMSFFHGVEHKQGKAYLFAKYFGELGSVGDSILLAKHVMEFSKSHGLYRMREHNPNMKIIVCLRDPIDRLLSAYEYAVNEGWENKDLQTALNLESSRLKKSWQKNKSLGYVNNGLYGTNLTNVLDIFPKSQVLVINYNDFKNDVQSTLFSVYDFLNLERIIPSEYSRKNVTTVAKSKLVARIVRSILSSNGPVKKIVKKVIPIAKQLIVRNWLLSLNRTKKISTKPVLDSSTEAMLSAKFAADFEQLPAQYQVWFSKYSRS